MWDNDYTRVWYIFVEMVKMFGHQFLYLEIFHIGVNINKRRQKSCTMILNLVWYKTFRIIKCFITSSSFLLAQCTNAITDWHALSSTWTANGNHAKHYYLTPSTKFTWFSYHVPDNNRPTSCLFRIHLGKVWRYPLWIWTSFLGWIPFWSYPLQSKGRYIAAIQICF